MEVTLDGKRVLADVVMKGTWRASGTVTLPAFTAGGTVTLDAQNIATDTTTGTKIGTATNQKLGFYNKAPTTQNIHIVDAPGDSTANNATTINAILAALETYGLLATG